MHGFEKISKKELHSLIRAYNLHHSIRGYSKYKVNDLRNILGAKYVLRDGRLYEWSPGMGPVAGPGPVAMTEETYSEDEEETPPPPPPKELPVPRVKAATKKVFARVFYLYHTVHDDHGATELLESLPVKEEEIYRRWEDRVFFADDGYPDWSKSDIGASIYHHW